MTQEAQQLLTFIALAFAGSAVGVHVARGVCAWLAGEFKWPR